MTGQTGSRPEVPAKSAIGNFGAVKLKFPKTTFSGSL